MPVFGGRSDVIPAIEGSSHEFFIISCSILDLFSFLFSQPSYPNPSRRTWISNMDAHADAVKNVYQSTPYQAAGAALMRCAYSTTHSCSARN